MGMREELAKIIQDIPHNDGDRLPSVREIMKAYGVSSSTVQSALKMLEKASQICRIQGKGCFWTSGGVAKIYERHPAPQARESAYDKVERLFREDWDRGTFRIDELLPLMKELAQRYNVSQAILRNFLNAMVQKGALSRSGRHYSFIRNSKNEQPASLSEIIFVTRCNSWGGFTAESEREMDFLRMVYKKAGADNYKLILLGMNENSGKLIDRSGKTRKLADYPNAVGAILSTLLIMQPLKLMQQFAGIRYPIAVWWEQPLQDIPLRYLQKENWTFFNSTFGTAPGKEMGKFLIAHGVNQVAYFSPYHDSSWSIDRLQGLRDAGLSVIDYTDSEFASPWDYKQIARSKVEKFSVEVYARELLKQKMVSLMKNRDYEQVAIVCVNDDVASALLEMQEEGRIEKLGPLYAFDNSAESYMLRLPSYDFNTQALVDHMFYSIANTDAFRMQRKVQQILGQVVEK
jgi:DNA-binding transcriptional regulator YhcF (GntR family)